MALFSLNMLEINVELAIHNEAYADMALKFIQHFCSIASATIHAGGNTGKFGLGPTAVLLKQQKGWTYGVLANHLWSVAGDGNRDDVSATFLQPFVSYTTKKFTTFGVNTESTYDWENSQWTVPLVGQVSQLVKVGKQPVQFTLGAKYFADKPDGGPDWGLRFAVTFLFPK